HVLEAPARDEALRARVRGAGERRRQQGGRERAHFSASCTEGSTATSDQPPLPGSGEATVGTGAGIVPHVSRLETRTVSGPVGPASPCPAKVPVTTRVAAWKAPSAGAVIATAPDVHTPASAATLPPGGPAASTTPGVSSHAQLSD